MLNVEEENFLRRESITTLEHKLNKKSFTVDHVTLRNNRKLPSEICILKQNKYIIATGTSIEQISWPAWYLTW